ncbi:MAG: hypothetical protein IJ191_04535 [Treponema sp.]|nr:hypothetical protein [Treponema sp.]
MNEQTEKPLFFRLLFRSVLFLALFLAILITLYGIGNVQRFIDPNQLLILKIARAVAALLVPFAVVGTVVSLVLLIHGDVSIRRLSYAASSIGMVLAALFGAVAVVFVQTLIVLAR